MTQTNTPDRSIDVNDYDPDFCRQRLLDMLRIRRMEERCAQLYGESKIRGFLHLYIGEEAVAGGVFCNLKPEDKVIATYREHAHALLRGISMNAIMAEMYGKQEGCSRGRGGSMHLFDRNCNFYGGNAIVGAGLPTAVGLALADRMQGRKACVTVCFFGEGAVAEGVFHESLNLAALWRLPVLFICENNLYAMGTALARSEAQISLTAKAASEGLPTGHINGMSLLAVHAAASRAIDFVRREQTPFFLELHTYRFRAHSMYDAELYRDKQEIERWKAHDPISNFAAKLKEANMLSAQELVLIDGQAQQEVEAAVRYAESGSLEPVEHLLDDVMSAATQQTKEEN